MTSGASLNGADLQGACLSHADLRGVAMMGANLADADLEGVSLWGAGCSQVNLTQANLRSSDLRGASLIEADLTGANLHRSDLCGANLMGADLSGTDLQEARLAGVGLTFARYDANTRWPKGFNPREHFAALVGWFVEAQPGELGTIDEAQAVEIARRAVAANETWADRATYEATKDDDGWSVYVWRIEGYGTDGEPLFTVGGDRFIEINKHGKVIQYGFGR